MNNSTTPKTPVLCYSLDSTIDQVDFAQLRDEWILPELLIRKLARHYLLYWDKKFLVDSNGLQDGIVLCHQERKYITILTSDLHEFGPASRIALSFRHPVGTKFGYVLIKPAIKRYGAQNEH